MTVVVGSGRTETTTSDADALVPVVLVATALRASVVGPDGTVNVSSYGAVASVPTTVPSTVNATPAIPSPPTFAPSVIVWPSINVVPAAGDSSSTRHAALDSCAPASPAGAFNVWFAAVTVTAVELRTDTAALVTMVAGAGASDWLTTENCVLPVVDAVGIVRALLFSDTAELCAWSDPVGTSDTLFTENGALCRLAVVWICSERFAIEKPALVATWFVGGRAELARLN